jgi:hypothetical protein
MQKLVVGPVDAECSACARALIGTDECSELCDVNISNSCAAVLTEIQLLGPFFPLARGRGLERSPTTVGLPGSRVEPSSACGTCTLLVLRMPCRINTPVDVPVSRDTHAYAELTHELIKCACTRVSLTGSICLCYRWCHVRMHKGTSGTYGNTSSGVCVMQSWLPSTNLPVAAWLTVDRDAYVGMPAYTQSQKHSCLSGLQHVPAMQHKGCCSSGAERRRGLLRGSGPHT